MRALVAACLLCATVAHAGKLEQIRARGKLIASVKNDANRPHKDPAHNQKRGFEVELTRALAKRILGDESKVELRILSRPARLPMLSAGAVDVVVSMIPMTADSLRQVDFSHPYFASGLSLLVRAGIRLEDLTGKTIAFRQQSFNQYGAELQRIAAERNLKVTVRYYPTIEAAADAMVKGEAAAVGGNFVDLDTYRKQRAGFDVDTTLLEERQVGVAVKKGDADLLAAVNLAIDELRKSGQLKRMTEKWRLPYLLGE